jgi:RecA-family ATPase
MRYKLEEAPLEVIKELLARPGMPLIRDYPAWHHEAMNSVEPPWLIDRMLPAKAFTLITGWPKLSKKSWLATALAFSVASGKDAFGLRPTGKVKVLYAYLEDVARDVAERNERLMQGMGLSLDDLSGLDWWHLDSFLIDKVPDFEWMAAQVITHGYQLIVLDTFAHSFAGRENDADQINVAMRHIRELNRLGAAVLLVHHTTKSTYAVDGGVPRPGRDIRGSGAMEGAMVHHLAVRVYPQDPAQFYLASHGKRYNDWLTYDWTMPPPGTPGPAVLNLAPTDEPHFEVEDPAPY